MRRIKYYCNDCKKEFIFEGNKIMSETNHCMYCLSKNIKKIKTYEGPCSEIGAITIEKINERAYEVVLDFGEGQLLQIGIDNNDQDVSPELLDKIMEALQRSYMLQFKEMYMVREILKGLIRRVQ